MLSDPTPRLVVSRTLLPSPADWAVALALAAVPAAVSWWWLGGKVWNGRPATCFPAACFCEAVRANGIRQPANTLSSFAFLPIAILIVFRLVRRSGSVPPTGGPFTRDPVYAILFASALVVIGLGSAFFHASLTFVGQAIDVSGMYLLGTFAVLYASARLRPMAPVRIAVSYVALNAGLIALLLSAPTLRRYMFALLIVVAIGLEVRARRTGPATATRYFIGAIGLIALGFLVWNLDRSRVVCMPFGLLQGHAVWHTLSALAAGSLYLYYESEIRPAGQ